MDGKIKIVCSERTTNSGAGSSRESLITPQQSRSEVVLKASDLDSKPICRICYGGSSRERLLKPCKCKGTIEYVHRNCLERWLESKNYETCELCHHHFETKKTRKGCWDWIRQPETQAERRNFIGDFTCFAFLTPLGIATFWLCAEGAIYYQRVKNSTLETVALVTLAVFLVMAYFTWIILCTRYHILMWTRWRNHNWNVRIVDRTLTEGSSRSSNTVVEIPSDSTEDSLQESWQSLKYTTTTEQVEIPVITTDVTPQLLVSSSYSSNEASTSTV